MNFARFETIASLALQANMSQRHFIRRFKAATGLTPMTYLQRVRIEAARKALELTDQKITEILYNIGYADVKSFRKLFRQYTGLTPRAYKKKFEPIRIGSR